MIIMKNRILVKVATLAMVASIGFLPMGAQAATCNKSNVNTCKVVISQSGSCVKKSNTCSKKVKACGKKLKSACKKTKTCNKKVTICNNKKSSCVKK